MDRITQEAYYRQRVLKYAAKHGVTKAAERYRLSRKTVHKWKGRYDSTIESLKNRSRAPLHSPLKQSDWEIQLVQRYAKKYPRDLLLGYEKAQKRGYVQELWLLQANGLEAETARKEEAYPAEQAV